MHTLINLLHYFIYYTTTQADLQFTSWFILKSYDSSEKLDSVRLDRPGIQLQ